MLILSFTNSLHKEQKMYLLVEGTVNFLLYKKG